MKTDSDILTSRLLVPRHTDVLLRPRIDAKISRIQNIKLLMVTAGAGYGKTIAVSSFINAIDAESTWYRIAAQETDCLTFIRYLICGIRMHHSAFCGQPVEEHFQYGGMPAVCSYVARELENKIRQAFYIVLDDWHLVRDHHQIIDFVAFLIDNTHANIHFILNSRGASNLPVAKLIASGDAEEITEADLRFNREEAAFFFKEHHSSGHGDEQLEQHVNAARGWAAGLRLLSLGFRKAQESTPPNASAAVTGSDTLFSDYLDQTIFSPLPADQRRFLMITSLLPTLRADFCDRLLNNNDSLKILEFLNTENLFTNLLDPKGHVYSYHPLFQTFLENTFEREFAPSQKKQIYSRIAEFLVEDGQWEYALPFYFRANDFESVTELLKHRGLPAILEGRSQLIASFHDQLGDAIVLQNPWLMLHQSYIHSLSGAQHKAAAMVAGALVLFRKDQCTEGVQHCLARQAEAAFQMGDMVTARHILSAVLEGEINDASLKFHMLTMLSFASSYMADFKTAETVLARIETLIPHMAGKESIDFLHETFDFIRMTYFQHKGAFLQVKSSMTEDVDNIHIKLNRFQADAWTHYHLGEFERGYARARMGIEFLKEKQFNDAFLEAWCHIGMAVNLAGMNQPDNAQPLLEKSLRFFKGRRFKWGIAFADFIAGMLAFKSGDYEACLTHATSGIRQINGMGLVLVESVLQAMAVKTHLMRGNIAAARDVLTDFTTRNNTAKLFGSKLIKAHFDAMTAVVHIQSGMVASGLSALNRFWEICSAQHYDINEILSHELFLLITSSADSEVKTDHAYTHLSDYFLKNHRSPKGLHIRLLGRFRVRAKGTEIPAKRWNNRKAATLFQYLIFYRRKGFIKKEILMELLWPEQDPGKTSKRFHVTLAALRKILEPDIRRGVPSAYIKSAKDAYMIDPGEGAWIDIEAFSWQYEHIDRMAHPARPVEKLLACLDLYGGDFLEEAAFSPWCSAIRDAFRERCLNLLLAVIEAYESVGAYATCIDYAHRYLEKEKYNEVVYQKQMLYYARLDRKDMIRNVFERCRQSIVDELGCPLSPKTVDLFRSLAG